jgi:hypothetical protein
MMVRLTPTRSRADQAKTSLFRERQEMSFPRLARSGLRLLQPFAKVWPGRLVPPWFRRCFVVVLYFFVGDWAGPFKTFVLCCEAVYVQLPWNEVSFNITRSLLVAINCDHTLRTQDFHAKEKSVNGRFKLVDGAPAHYGVVRVYHVDDVEGDLLALCIGCYTE